MTNALVAGMNALLPTMFSIAGRMAMPTKLYYDPVKGFMFVSMAEFASNNPPGQKESTALGKHMTEEYEIPNADIIDTFDADIINHFYRYE